MSEIGLVDQAPYMSDAGLDDRFADFHLATGASASIGIRPSAA